MPGEKDNLFSSLPENLPKEEEKQTSKLPEELQGKSPEEMYEMLASENERLLEEQKTEYEKNKQSQQGQQGQGGGYQQPNAGASQPQKNWNYGNQGLPSGQQQEDVDYWTDPDKFMDQQLQRRLQPIVQSTVQSVRGTNKNSFIRDVGDEDWQKYGNEVEQLIDSFSPEVQMHPNAYKQAYNIVLANHLDEVTSSRAEKLASEKLQRTLSHLGVSEDQLREALGQDGGEGQGGQQQSQASRSLFQRNIGVKPQVESGSRGSGYTPQAPQGNGKRLSDRERQIASEFGMTEKEYKEWSDLNTDAISQFGG